MVGQQSGQEGVLEWVGEASLDWTYSEEACGCSAGLLVCSSQLLELEVLCLQVEVVSPAWVEVAVAYWVEQCLLQRLPLAS